MGQQENWRLQDYGGQEALILNGLMYRNFISKVLKEKFEDLPVQVVNSHPHQYGIKTHLA